jgi:hypothetical protein
MYQIKERRIITRSADEKLGEYLESVYAGEQGREIYKARKEKVEHPFGHFKRNLGIGQFSLRGRSGAKTELSIMAVCFNLSRMMNIIGHSGLMMKLNAL